MRTTTTQKLAELQRCPSHVRNLCILAHVDHGKTTLADALVASNGIISQRMAGKLRYMDSREDEQTRGITMKASAISLHYQTENDEYLVNLIDSPGHVDFSSEVSTAVRLCDGAVVVVDVVEGVCPQTHAVLRQAWLENLRPILVLNKLDRLITELKMEPTEAYMHLQQILEHVNVVTSELFTADMMSMQTTPGSPSQEQTQNYDWTEDADEHEHKNIYFAPDLGNVVFAAAYDGWGFTVDKFAKIYSKKLGMNEEGLCKTLWGDFYLNNKTKRIMKGAQSKGKKPLFVQFVLESVWSVYDAVMIRRDKDMTEKIVSSLGLKISVRDVRQNDPRVQLQAMMGQWLPVSNAVLGKVVEKLPSPLEISEEKVEKLMCNQARRFDSLPQETQALKQDFLQCSASDEAPVILFVSKMFPVDQSALPQNKQRPLTDEELQQRRDAARQRHAARMEQRDTTEGATKRPPEGTTKPPPEGAIKQTAGGDTDQVKCGNTQITEAGDQATNTDAETAYTEMSEKQADTTPVGCDGVGQTFVAFARVYSGTVRKGQKLYILGPKHDPAKALQKIADSGGGVSAQKLHELTGDDHVTVATVSNLFMFMGRELEALDSVPAGNVLGIGGLEEHILKSGTVSSTVACSAFTDLYFDAAPILRVALEPVHAGEMGNLIRGLRLLNQADPCVQVLVQETGEHVIITAGEVHLRRCLDDLQDTYAKIKVSASSPIVPFRETIVPVPIVDMVNESIQDQCQKPCEFENNDDEEIIERGLVKMYTPSKNCMIQVRALPLPPEVTDFLDENQFLIKTLDQYVSAKMSEKHKSDIQIGSKLKHSTKEAMKEFKDKLEGMFAEAGNQWEGFVENIWAFGPKRVGPNLLVNKVVGYERTSIWDCLRKDMKEGKLIMKEYDYSVVSGFQLATLVGPLCDEPMRGVCFVVEDWEVDSSHGKSGAQSNANSGESSATHQSRPSHDIELQLTNISLERIENSDSQSSGGNLGASLIHSGCVNPTTDNITRESASSKACDSNDSQTATDLSNGVGEKLYNQGQGHSGQGQMAVQGYISGQLMSIVKESCQKSFQTQPRRLMAAMYKCTIQATTDVLGKLFAVIGKRHGKILQDEMMEGSQIFNIVASIPVVESFGFCEDIRKRTSGLASPQLVFSHWEVIDIDPFWVPTTEEEIMHYGEKADSDNRARIYMDNVRERKGLKVDKKIVEHAEKQRTLTKNK